jgi:hypothetical protein
MGEEWGMTYEARGLDDGPTIALCLGTGTTFVTW